MAYTGPLAGELKDVFVTFCSFGSSKKVEEMDGAKFAKFCRDTGLLDKKVTSTDVDLTFAKAKAKTARKIGFGEFVAALELLGAKKGCSLDEIVSKAVAAGGPMSSGTQADAVKFHDDKSLYTGVYAKGGPTNVDNKITLSNLADRSSADVRGIKTGQIESPTQKADKSSTRAVAAPTAAAGGPVKKRGSSDGSTGGLAAVFNSFCSFGGGSNADASMDGAKFAKLCRDCGLLDKKLTATSVDLIFSKVKTKGERKIGYPQFQQAVGEIAKTKGISQEQAEAQIASAGGPASSGTVADAVKFHDDKSLYTGVHANGGPTTVDNAITLSGLADRTAADIRGIKLN